MKRCICIAILVCCVPGALIWAAEHGDVTDMDSLTALAETLAQREYSSDARTVPAFLTRLGYDEYRDLQYREEKALWHDDNLPFELTFFHAGYIYPSSVSMYRITNNGVIPFAFSPDQFEYGPQAHLIDQLPAQLDFSGFHIWHKGTAGQRRAVGLFQGASYFRMVSSFAEYGLSARTVAVNTSNAAPEEFPDFTAFWFRQPDADDQDFTFYGLLDSPSVVGAFSFKVTPGATVRLQVNGRLILRQPVAELGLAPFSSMFWFGENSAKRPADFRPEVHDSDGLLIFTDEGATWRPLSNPPATRTDVIAASHVQAFGLLQRDRDFEHYQDIEARYHQRPDAWVIPGSGMQRGNLHLLEIESPHEYADNIALVWVPDTTPAPGEIFAYDYEIQFGEMPPPELAHVVATRYGDSLRDDGSIEFVIDFAGGQLAALAETELDVISEIAGGKLIWQDVRKNPFNNTWRLNLRVAPEASSAGVRLRARLHNDQRPLSEIWQYWWQ